MSRPRTATNILEAKGAFKKDPARKRIEPKCLDPFPARAPSHLNPLQVKHWHRVRKMIPAGVLQGSDVLAVELAAVLWAEFVVSPAEMNNGRIGQMQTALGKLGLSPSDRAKLSASPAKEAGDFDEF
jgi:phage terminase small subunit